MERRSLGKTDMRVSVLGFGGAEIGFEGATEEKVSRLLNSALDAGLNVIDTAECYSDGSVSSEDLIGRSVGHRRRDFYLFTKCGHEDGMGLADWSVPLLEKSIERSLQRLRTDCLDLIQLHSCDEATLRAGEVIEVLRRVREKGKARYLGYSGDGLAALYAVQCGAFDTLQTSINLADQEAIELTLPEAVNRGMGVIAKRPIANAAWKTGRKPENRYHHTYWDRLQKLDYDFLRGDLTPAVGIALRFTLGVPGVGTTIVGTQNPDRWHANAALLERGPLSPDEAQAIRSRWKAVATPDWVGQI